MRIGMVTLTDRTVRQILNGACFLHDDLPADARVIRVSGDSRRNAITVIVESEEFEEVESGFLPPDLGPRIIELLPCVKARMGMASKGEQNP